MRVINLRFHTTLNTVSVLRLLLHADLMLYTTVITLHYGEVISPLFNNNSIVSLLLIANYKCEYTELQPKSDSNCIPTIVGYDTVLPV